MEVYFGWRQVQLFQGQGLPGPTNTGARRGLQTTHR